MPYTKEKTSNTIEDKNTIKSKTYFHCGPQHKTSGKGKKKKIYIYIYYYFIFRYIPKWNVHGTVIPVLENFDTNRFYRYTHTCTLELQISCESTIWICSASHSGNKQCTHSTIPLAQNINQSHWWIWYRRALIVAVLLTGYGKSCIYWLAPLVWICQPLDSSNWS